MNPKGVSLFKGGTVEFRPGAEIDLEEYQAIEIADCLEQDEEGNPVIVRSLDEKKVEEAKALDEPPVDRMIRRSRAVRK